MFMFMFMGMGMFITGTAGSMDGIEETGCVTAGAYGAACAVRGDCCCG